MAGTKQDLHTGVTTGDMIPIEIHTALFSLGCLLSGIFLCLGGGLQKKYPPKRINPLYGYRTPSSKKSQERWDFAQRYSAQLMVRIGLALMVAGLLSLGIKLDPLAAIILFLVTTALVLSFLVYRVEKTLKTKFK